MLTIKFSDKNHLEMTLKEGADKDAILRNARHTLYNSGYTRFTLKDLKGEIICSCDRSSTKDLHETLAATRPSRDNYIEYINVNQEEGDVGSIALILARNARQRDLFILQKLAQKRGLFSGAFKSIYRFISKIIYYLFLPLSLMSGVLHGISKLIDQPFLLLSNATRKGIFYRVFSETAVEEFTWRSGHMLRTDIQLERYQTYQEILADFDEYGGNPGQRLTLNPSRTDYPKEIVIRLGDASALVKRQDQYTWSRYNPLGYLDYCVHVLLSGIADFCTLAVSTVLTVPLWLVSLIFVAPGLCFKDPLVENIASLQHKIHAYPQEEIDALQDLMGFNIFQQAVLSPPTAPVEAKADEHTDMLSQPLLSPMEKGGYGPSFWSVHQLNKEKNFDPNALGAIASFL